MSNRCKPLAGCFVVLLLLVLSGCGRKDGESAPAAAIGTEQGAAATSDVPVPPKPPYDWQHPVLLIETSLGNITVQLDADAAPMTVENFLTYVRAGAYDQTIVHQIYQGQGFLAGGYDTNRIERRAGRTILNEARADVKNLRGAIAMVRQPDDPHSAASQFFINVADNPALDHQDETAAGFGYCVFGKVIEGMDVVDRIGSAPVHDTPEFEQTPVEAIEIRSIRLR